MSTASIDVGAIIARPARSSASVPAPASLVPLGSGLVVNADGDLVVDEWLTIMRGTKPEKVAEILRRYKSGRFLDRIIDIDQRMRGASIRKAAENKALGGTPGQRDKAWRSAVDSFLSGRSGRESDVAELVALGAVVQKRRKGARK